MKKSFLLGLMLLLTMTASLSGCVIWPWWEDDGGHHHGEYHEWHHGEHEGAYGERR